MSQTKKMIKSMKTKKMIRIVIVVKVMLAVSWSLISIRQSLQSEQKTSKPIKLCLGPHSNT